ncbi:MAG: DUF2029 domain-containing protein [Mediterranea sp.]|jgi:hypothetical protein|nr:DUF2029 domain-containing protein [Mediterranea sp.]
MRQTTYWQTFWICALGFAALWALLLVADPSRHQLNVFFRGGDDFLADYFNHTRYAAGRDPYFNTINGLHEHIYPPLCYLLLYPQTLFVPYSSMSLAECWTSPAALLCAGLFLALSLFFYLHSLFLLCRKFEAPRYLWIVILFSSVSLFALERGNFILLTAACVNYFICFKDSGRKRWLCVLCLALASTFKVFPVLFALYYLRRREYRTFVAAGVVTALLVFVPFLFFKHGLVENLEQLLRNISAQTPIYGMSKSPDHFGVIAIFLQVEHSLGLSSSPAVYSAGKWLNYGLGLCTLFLFFKASSPTLRLGLLSMMCALFPQQASVYSGVYLFPLLIALASARLSAASWTKREKKLYGSLILLFVLALLPLQLGKATYYINNGGFVLMWTVLLALAFAEWRRPAATGRRPVATASAGIG